MCEFKPNIALPAFSIRWQELVLKILCVLEENMVPTYLYSLTISMSVVLKINVSSSFFTVANHHFSFSQATCYNS